MGVYLSLAVLVGILAGGAPPEAPASPPVPKMPRADAGTPADNGGEVVVLPENATIRIAPGARYSVRPVQTTEGPRVRLEVQGVVVEASRLRIKSKGKVHTLQARDGCRFDAT